MPNLNWGMIMDLVQTASVLVALLVGTGTIRGRKDEQVIQMANIQKDIEFIKDRISGHEALRDMATRALESSKSAHNRINEHLQQEHGPKT